MSKVVILLSLALFFCVVVAEDTETDELMDICQSINDASQPKEIKSRGRECNDLLHNLVAKKGEKGDNVRIRFLGGADALSAFSSHATAAMNSFKNRLTEEQYALMLKIHALTRQSVTNFNQAGEEFKNVIVKPGNNDRFKEVDTLLTKAGASIFEIQTHIDQKFESQANVPELRKAIEYGVKFMSAVSRIKKDISEF